MITSKLTRNARTTIPQPGCAALRLDELAYTIEEGRVILTRALSLAVDEPFAMFTEWDSDEDRRAYARLLSLTFTVFASSWPEAQ